MRRLTTSRIGWSLVAVLALGTIFTNPVQAKTTNNPPLKLKVESQPVSKEGSKMSSFAPVIKKTSPSVVNIYSTKMVRSNPNSRGNPLYNDPLFRRFFGQNPEEEEAEETLAVEVVRTTALAQNRASVPESSSPPTATS